MDDNGLIRISHKMANIILALLIWSTQNPKDIKWNSDFSGGKERRWVLVFKQKTCLEAGVMFAKPCKCAQWHKAVPCNDLML